MQQLLAKPWYDMSLYNLPSTGDYIDGMVIDWSSSWEYWYTAICIVNTLDKLVLPRFVVITGYLVNSKDI